MRERTIRPGDGVILLTGSANQDEAAFENPDAFDIARKGPRHSLAWRRARFFAEALRSTSVIRLSDEPHYRPSTVVRGLAELPLNLERN